MYILPRQIKGKLKNDFIVTKELPSDCFISVNEFPNSFVKEIEEGAPHLIQNGMIDVCSLYNELKKRQWVSVESWIEFKEFLGFTDWFTINQYILGWRYISQPPIAEDWKQVYEDEKFTDWETWNKYANGWVELKPALYTLAWLWRLLEGGTTFYGGQFFGLHLPSVDLKERYNGIFNHNVGMILKLGYTYNRRWR